MKIAGIEHSIKEVGLFLMVEDTSTCSYAAVNNLAEGNFYVEERYNHRSNILE